jgi:hypothetical protein
MSWDRSLAELLILKWDNDKDYTNTFSLIKPSAFRGENFQINICYNRHNLHILQNIVKIKKLHGKTWNIKLV